MNERKKAIATGKLFDQYDCYVLDGGARVLSKRGVVALLTSAREVTPSSSGAKQRLSDRRINGFDSNIQRLAVGPNSGRKRGDLDEYLSALPSRYEHLAAAANFVEFTLPGGRVGHAVAASTVIAICSAYVQARDNGELRKNQEHLARAASSFIVRAAETGLAALIDEATGYEAIRQRGDLARVFREAAGVWELTFTPDLARALCRLGIAGDKYRTWAEGSYPAPLSGAFHRIYSLILGAEAKRELKARNPEPRRGKNHHQWLTDEARELLSKNMLIIRFCARTSSSASDFWERLTDHYAGQGRIVFSRSA